MIKEYKKDTVFCEAVEFIFALEGGYSNHKDDLGGATNFGVTQATYNCYRHSHNLKIQPVKMITKDEALEIYYEDFWLKSGADKIDDKALAIVLFDSCVNHGVRCGLTLMDDAKNDVHTLLNLRRVKYRNITLSRPTQRVFLKGWMNRIDKLENFVSSKL